jgi:hypothetical protein
MTDSHKEFVRTDIRPGAKVLYARLELSREQILRRGEWFDKVPVVKTVNYLQNRAGINPDTDVILVPNLRAGTGTTEPITSPQPAEASAGR